MTTSHPQMTEDEIGMFKHEMFVLAMQRMRECDAWDRHLAGNCLPACLCILAEVQGAYPGASVKIGDLGKIGDLPPNEKPFHQFLSGQLPSPPAFHAWLDLGGQDLFDPVGPSWLNQGGLYLDAQQAEEQGLKYFEVLTDQGDVNAFYQRLRCSRTSA